MSMNREGSELRYIRTTASEQRKEAMNKLARKRTEMQEELRELNGEIANIALNLAKHNGSKLYMQPRLIKNK